MKFYRIIVTGGSGFIGSNLIEKLLFDGHTVLNIDFNKPKKIELLKNWANVDLNRYEILDNTIKEFSPEYIVHFAARTDLDGTSLEDYSSNIQAVENLLKVCNGLLSLNKIIITSSMLVCRAGYQPNDQFDYSPTTIYGESKVMTEKIVWNNKPLCDWAIIRPTSIWGPWFGKPYKDFFDMVIAKKFFHIGSKGCTKTYGYVGNAIYQVEKILFTETRNELNKVFYIGDNPPTNIEEWGNEIANELGTKIRKVPYFVIKMAAYFGDALKLMGISFPMNSFRLNNMTTDNIVNLGNTYEIAPTLPFTRKEGIKTTLKWIFDKKI